MKNIVKITFAASLSPLFVFADDDIDLFNMSLEQLAKIEVVTAASGFEQKSTRAPATVTVISAEEWQSKGARLLSDVLSAVPGFHVGKAQADYRHKKFFIRGLSGYGSGQIKLLIDGEPFESIQDNSLFLGLHMPLTNFKRIEVIKGPGSAIYGADAFGGIINLVSYQEDMPAIFGGRVGSFDTLDFYGAKGFDIGNSRLQLSFDYSRSDDDKDRIVNADIQSVFDQLFGTSASKTPGPIDEHYDVFTMLAKWQYENLAVDYFTWRNFDYGNSAGVAQALDPDSSGSTYASQFKVTYDFSNYVSGSLKGLLNYQDQKINSYLSVFPAGSKLPIGNDGNIDFVNPVGFTTFEDGLIGTPSPRSHSVTARLTHLFNLSDNHLIRWELGYEELTYRTTEQKNFGPGILDGSQTSVSGELTDVTGTSFIYLPNVKRDFYYLSFQDEWQITPETQLTFGVRYDKYSDFGSTTNPRLGLIWQATNEVRLKLFAGSAFRAPSIAQLYSKNNPASIGNPELRSESVDTIETGANLEYYVNQDLVVSLNAFRYHAKDLIAFVFNEEQQLNIAQNIGEQKGKGGEFTIKWKPQPNISVDSSISVLSAKDELQNDLADVPLKMAYVGINWQFANNWHWSLDAKWIANRKRAQGDQRPELPNYLYATTKLGRENILPNLSVGFTAKNLLDDTDAREPSNGSIPEDYPIAGRLLMLELDYKF